LADGRNDGKWYDSDGLFDDNFSYAVQGEDSVYVDITNGTGWSQLNLTRAVEASAFRKSTFLSNGMMEKESKKEYIINKKDNILIKFWNLQNMRGEQNYTACIFRNINYTGNPDRNLKSHFCNESYDPTGSIKTQDSTNCVFINSLDETDLDDIYYTSRNSSYSKGCFGIINGMLGGIEVTDTFYISYESKVNGVVGDYVMRYANGTSGTNVSFKDTEVAWTSTDDGTTWTQAEFTPDIWLSSINDGDQFQAGVYVEDILGNSLTNFTFYTDDIGDVNYPISSPHINWFYSEVTGKDEDTNETHNGLMQIDVGIAIDPDANGAVNHSLYLVNIDGLLNYTINDSIYSADDSDVNITFDTSLVADGVYRMNVTAVADDNSLDIQSYITPDNFTIDNTAPTIHWYNITPDTIEATLETSYIYINVSDPNGIECWNFTIQNPNGSISLNMTCVITVSPFWWTDDTAGVYNITISATDNLGNHITEVRNVTLTDTTDPTITILNPTDQDSTTNSSVRFIYNITDNTNPITNCSLYINNELNLTNYTIYMPFAGESVTLNFTQNFSEGTYTWNITCYDSVYNSNSSIIRNFTIDNTAPVVNITYPTNGSTHINTLNISFEYTVVDTNLDTCWYSIMKVSNTSYETSNTTLASCANTTIKFDYYSTYRVYLYANDTAGTISAVNHIVYTSYRPPAEDDSGGGGSGGIDPCPANMYYADGECHLITLPTINGTRTGTEAKEFIETTFDKILNIGQNIYPQNPGGGWIVFFVILIILYAGVKGGLIYYQHRLDRG